MPVEVAPQGWTSTSLGRIAEYVNGYAFQPRDWGVRGLPIIRIAQMQDAEASCDYYTGILPERYRVDSGDLLFSWSATLMALIWERGPAYVNQHIFKVVPSNDIRAAA
jgi:type I restriction enzyme, S subunit